MNRSQSQEVVSLALQSSPSFFFEEILGEHPYLKQIEIVEALKDHSRVSVVGCNSSGKDWAAGRALLWWLHSRRPSKVLVYGPTHRQVNDIVFNEVRAAFRSSRRIDGFSLDGRVYETSRFEIDESTFGLGFATNDAFNLLGFHSPHLLVIVTEAHAVSSRDIDAIRRLNPEAVLMTGNPFVSSGPFYDSHHQHRARWKTINISAYDTPNLQGGDIPGMITEADVEARREEWGEDSAMYRGSILGEFVEELDDTILPLSAIRRSVAREAQKDGEIIVACDVARFGKDKTVVVHRQGDHAEIVNRTQGRDLMQTAGWLGRYCDDVEADLLVVDDTGLGGGVVDRLKEMPMRAHVVGFIAGARADRDDRFSNQTAEAWWNMRDWVLNTGRVPGDDELIGQLASRRYTIRSDKKIALESKTTMDKSPDEADALAMTFAQRPGVGIW